MTSIDQANAVGAHELAAPTGDKSRIETLDILRGIALLGILIINMPVMGLSYDVAINPGLLGLPTDSDFWSWYIPSIFFEGTFRTIFGILFGAGVYLFLSRLEESVGAAKAKSLHLRRSMWLIVFGLVDAYLLIWIGDILFAYGLMGLFIWAFRKMSLRKLIIWILVFTSISFLLKLGNAAGSEELFNTLKDFNTRIATGEQLEGDDLKAYQKLRSDMSFQFPTADQVRESMAQVRSGYIGAFNELWPISLLLQTYLFLLFGLWDSAITMLLGIALFKTGFLTGEKSQKTYLILGLIGYAVAVPIRYVVVGNFAASEFDPVILAWGNLSYDLVRVAMAIGHISIAVFLFKSAKLPLANALASVGQMALTNYLMHSVVALMLFIILGQYGNFSRLELTGLTVGIWIFQLWFSPFWLKRYRYGPAEWLWRSLTYKKKQAFKHN